MLKINLSCIYPTDFTVVATELHPNGICISADFHCLGGFSRECERTEQLHDGILLDEETFRIRTAFLDHKTLSLAYARRKRAI